MVLEEGVSFPSFPFVEVVGPVKGKEEEPGTLPYFRVEREGKRESGEVSKDCLH